MPMLACEPNTEWYTHHAQLLADEWREPMLFVRHSPPKLEYEGRGAYLTALASATVAERNTVGAEIFSPRSCSMTARDLAELVRKMRVAQTRYFRSRDTGHLDESKKLEKAVDSAVNGILDKQLPLFPGEPEEGK